MIGAVGFSIWVEPCPSVPYADLCMGIYWSVHVTQLYGNFGVSDLFLSPLYESTLSVTHIFTVAAKEKSFSDIHVLSTGIAITT